MENDTADLVDASATATSLGEEANRAWLYKWDFFAQLLVAVVDSKPSLSLAVPGRAMEGGNNSYKVFPRHQIFPKD